MVCVCFRLGSPHGAVLAAVMDAVGAVIAPTNVRVHPHPGRPRYSRARYDAAIADPDLSIINVPGRNGSLNAMPHHRQGFWQVIVKLPDWPDDLGWIEELTGGPGFTAAMVGDADDRLAQSIETPDQYEVLGLSLEGQRVYRAENGFERVDVSQHWGRGVIGPGMWFWAASVMWFGAAAFDVVDRQRLVTFGDGVTVLPTGVVRVDLFDPAWPIEQIRERQRRFRDEMDYDRLEASKPDGVVNPSDPTVELIQFPDSEQVQFVTEWLDDDGNPTRRSKATRRKVSTLDERGELLHATTDVITPA